MLIGIGGTAITKPGGVAAAFNPQSISGLFVWLKGDVGVTADGSNFVSAWADQSGSGNNFTQATGGLKPLLTANAQNSKPAIVFDGINDYMLTGSITFGEWSMFAVCSKNWGTATYSGLWRHGFTTNAGRGFFTSGAANYDWQASEFIAVGNGYLAGQKPLIAGPHSNPTNGSYQLISAGVGTSSFLRRNGSSIARFTANLAGTSASDVFAIGTFNSVYASDFWVGGIAELLMYNSVLSAGNISKVEDYLKAKWATP
jgi:hypothetical protein